MPRLRFHPIVQSVLLVLLPLAAAWSAEAPTKWLDNQRKFQSDDPAYNFRRSQHFRILWGQGAGQRPEENNDFKQVTEQIAQGNLQMLEQLWHVLHDPRPQGLGFYILGETNKTAERDNNCYRANLVMNNTGIWAGGAWGACDEWGYPLFALPPGYLAFDPPSGATPHEYGHTVLIGAGGFNDTPYDGMWHEATANWLQLQFLNNYPGPGGVGTQPFLSVPHGRNYYDSWQIWEYFQNDPRYGGDFVSKVWSEGKGSRAKGAEYMFDAMVRLNPSGAVDSYNDIKDALGHMAARNVMWDYARQPFFQHHAPRTRDPMAEIYRRAYTELVRRGGDRQWFRVPFAHAPMQGGYNQVPIALEGKQGGGYKVSVDFRPLWDASRRSDWRATLVAVSDNGDARYSSMWNQGVNSITLSADENQLYLCVSATPDFMPFEGFTRPEITEPNLQPQAYEVAFVDTKATVYESKPRQPDGVQGAPHANGGGFVAASAKVEASAYVGPKAMVLGNAKVLGGARLEDYAIARDNAVVKDNARLSGHALVRDGAEISGNAKVRDWGTVCGGWKVFENARVLERAYLTDRGQLHGSATIKGATIDFANCDVKGYAIKEGDCANGANCDHQTLMCWVWGVDQKYADGRPDNGQLYCNFQFRRASPIFALDRFGVVHGYLMGGPKTVALDDDSLGGAVVLNGKDQYIELKRDVADFAETTLAAWVCWAGRAANEHVFYLGDGDKKYALLTPKDAAGKLRFAITAEGKQAERSLTAPALVPNRWTHVAVTFRDGGATLLVDGKQVAAEESLKVQLDDVLGENTLDGNDNMFLGRGASGGYFQGMLSDFRVYSLPQEAAAMAALAEGVKQRKAAPVAEEPDTAPPKFAGERFLEKPTWIDGEVRMSVHKATDESQFVEYLFTCKTTRQTSGWISSNRWTDCQAAPGKRVQYVCKARDKWGNQTPEIEASLLVPVSVAPLAAAFAQPPRGISDTAITMTAKRLTSHSGAVEYQFISKAGKKSGWQASPRWTDAGLEPGSQHAYSVQVRVSREQVSKWSAPLAAAARDDTPPARYGVGEWQTRPTATLKNTVLMKAMSVTGENGCPKIEQEPVDYYFQCTAGGGPDSGWIEKPQWETPELKDGAYAYVFKMRDRSPQKNETPTSAPMTVAVSAMTGYHPFAVQAIAELPEGTLVAFEATVSGVEPTAYLVSDNAAKIKVVPKTQRSATDVSLQGKKVKIQGCVWTVKGEKAVVWAAIE